VNGNDCIYRFGDVEVAPAAHRISRAGVELTVEPKAYAVLSVLLEQAGRAMERDELLDRVWGHRHVTPGVLNRVVAQLRKALGDDAEHPRYIQTLHSLGYRFIAEVQRVVPEAQADVAITADARAASVPSQVATEVTPELPETIRRHPAGRRLYDADANVAPAASDTPADRAPRFRYRGWLALAATLAVALAVAWLPRHPPAAHPPASVAVLPFTSLGGASTDAYFAEGLAIELHDALAGVNGLTVAALLSPRAGQQWKDAKAVGERLGVATVLDASVRREGERLRISAHLSDTATGYVLWSHVYERATSDVFATQREIAGEVVHALLGALPEIDERLAERLMPTANAAAFDAYLKGVHALRVNDDRAASYFGQALQEDTAFAAAQAGICRAQLWRFESVHDAKAFDIARQACLKAEAMDPTSSKVRLALGDLYQANGDVARAQGFYRPLLDDPARRPAALVGLSIIEADAGRHAQAAAYLQQALDARPGDADIYAQMGFQQYQSGHLPEAIATYARLVDLRPEDGDILAIYGAFLLLAGDSARASDAFTRSIAIKPSASSLSNLGTLRYQAGAYPEATALYRQATALEPKNYMLWGFLGDALLVDSHDAAQARAAFAEAAAQVETYLQVKQADAQALAAFGWYQANLGAPSRARDYAQRSEALPGNAGEVAILNAQTWAVLGDMAQAQRCLSIARAQGIDRVRLETNLIFQRAGLVQAPMRGNAD